ncbi:hypothetical protein [Paenibacillus tepidiphilus]|uniref:hypothetical protein n=1 Tax=Paenibacillus tepidiphilus TaxID=2608683 RepID=UPI00123BE357|nr:hypothetical protein [Paenibacillus tepidiphilus]
MVKNACESYNTFREVLTTIKIYSKFLVMFSLCFVALTGCANTDNVAAPTPTAETERIQGDWIRKKLDDYTNIMFRFAERLEITENENEYSLVLSFVPEVGSAPVKELIYQSMAEYAWSIHQFFPEVTRYEFHVLWDDRSKDDVMQALIDEEGVNELNNNYYSVKMDQRGELEASWRKVFSNITENEISQKWHDKDTGA